MFYLNKHTELTIALLDKMINHFRVNVEPQLNKYKNYYDGSQAILRKAYKDEENKAWSKTVINYCKNIVDNYCGYIATPSFISYKSEEDITDVMEILRYNDYQSEDASFLLDALIYGTAAELMYIDEDGQTRFRLINPTSCFGIYDDSLTGDLMYFVRMYKQSDWDETDLYFVDVYSDTDIKHYKMSGKNGYPVFISETPHYFNQCPANILNLPDERSIFDCILTQQDAYNELITSEISDYNAFCDAYMVLKGVDADADDIAAMKANRVLVLPENASAEWLTKNANDAQVENIKKDLHNSIYRIASCVDFSNETLMNGVASGISIQYKMCGQENRAAKIEAEMKKALQRRVELICGVAALKLGEEVFRDIQITFKRNIPEDITSTIAAVNGLKGTVSDATLLSQIPFVTDVNAELEALQKQKAENMALYNFGSSGTENFLDNEE